MNKQGEFTMNKTVKKSRFSQKLKKNLDLYFYHYSGIFIINVILLSFSEDVPVQFDRVEWLFPRQ